MTTHANKTKLIEEKKLLEEELEAIGRINETTGEWEAMPEAQTMPEADENDLSDRSEGFEERTGILAALSTRLSDINDSLKAMEDGSYGICKACGKHIEEDRLGANPAAQTCKECMEKVL